MISEEELQSAEQGIDFALGHAYYMKSIHGGKTKSAEMLRMMHYHPQQKIFQIYKFISSFNSVISSFKASPHFVQFICFLLDIL